MKKIIILILTLIALIFSSTVLAGNRFVDIGEFYNQKIFGRLQVQIEQDLSSNYISGIHLIKKSVEQFIRSVVA